MSRLTFVCVAFLCLHSAGTRGESPTPSHDSRPAPEAPKPPGGAESSTYAPDLPTFVYLTNCFRDGVIQSCFQSFVTEGLEACGYPNLVVLRDPKSPAAMGEWLANRRNLAQNRDNYLFLVNMHGWVEPSAGKAGANPIYQVGDGTKVSWSGDETVKTILQSVPPGPGKRVNLWLETCHSGACGVSPKCAGLGCASKASQVAMASIGTGKLISEVACDAASGRCSYFYDRSGNPRFDADGDGVIKGRELERLIHDYFSSPVDIQKSCLAPISSARRGLESTAIDRAQARNNACLTRESRWCERNGGTVSLRGREAVSIQGTIAVSGKLLLARRLPVTFENLPVPVRASTSSLKEAQALSVQLVQDPMEYAKAKVSPQQLYDAYLRTLPESPRPRRGTESTPPPAERPVGVSFDKATAGSIQFSLAQSLSCHVASGALNTGHYAEGLQTPEIRDFALNFPRCARRAAPRPRPHAGIQTPN